MLLRVIFPGHFFKLFSQNIVLQILIYMKSYYVLFLGITKGVICPKWSFVQVQVNADRYYKKKMFI